MLRFGGEGKDGGKETPAAANATGSFSYGFPQQALGFVFPPL